MKAAEIDYTFRLEDGDEVSYRVELAAPAYDYVDRSPLPPPDWARLGHFQCANCPLEETASPYCPVALNLRDLLHRFKDSISVEQVEVVITTPRRQIRRQGSLQYGLSSLMGLIMVTSGCPILDHLRPMAATHLPFASGTETLLRALGTFLTAQFMRERRGLEPAWSVAELSRLYKEIHIVNDSFSNRLRSVADRDATLNAIVQLDCFAGLSTLLIDEDQLDDLDPLFEAYYDEAVSPPAAAADTSAAS